MAITYEKWIRASAIEQDKDLFSCEAKEANGRGQMQFQGPMDRAMTLALFSFCMKVHHGTSPEEAFKFVDWPKGG